MKKLLVMLISLMMIIGMSACSKKGSMSGVSEEEGRYVVTFDNAEKDMSVTVEMTLGENQHFDFDHQLGMQDGVRVEYKNVEGEVLMENDLNDIGGGEVYLAAGDYTIVVTVTDKADGSLTLTVEDNSTDADMINPWKVAETLEEALAAAGVEFHSPIPEALPDDVEYIGCFYTEDTLQTNYSSDNNDLYFRVSKAHEGKEDLAGDYNEYAKTWKEYVKGLEVTCYGEEDSIHVGTFTVGDQHYALGYNTYGEGSGLSVDQLNSLLNGM